MEQQHHRILRRWFLVCSLWTYHLIWLKSFVDLSVYLKSTTELHTLASSRFLLTHDSSTFASRIWRWYMRSKSAGLY